MNLPSRRLLISRTDAAEKGGSGLNLETGKLLRGLIVGLALAAGAAVFPAARGAVTPEECGACHEDVAAAFATSTHGQAFRHAEDYAGASCESCHGPGVRHLESGDGADIVNPLKLEGEAADASCLSCHGSRHQHAYWQGGEHQAAGVACVDCHGVHAATPPRRGAKLLSARDLGSTPICLSCHSEQRKGLAQRSAHPLRLGKMECASCHDPHGTGGEHLLRADSVNDLCLSCHQEKRGPFLWEHSPVREDCRTCHAPHGSNHESLLVARVNQLCQSCHLQGRHQTVAGLPNEIWNSNRACLNCHSQVHGSNHPSGPLFQR